MLPIFNQPQHLSRRARPSYTLVEVLIVIAIIGILTSIGVVVIPNQRQRARNLQRVTGVKQIQVAMERYYSQHGKYPYPTLSNCASTSSMYPYSCMADGKDHNGSGTVNSNCIQAYDSSWAALYELYLKPYLTTMPNDPLDVVGDFDHKREVAPGSWYWGILKPDDKYRWTVIVSSPDDNHQHYLIAINLEPSGASSTMSAPGAITGFVRTQSRYYNAGYSKMGNIKFYSNNNKVNSAYVQDPAAQPQTCNDGISDAPIGMSVECGHIGATNPYGATFNVFCMGNISKTPTSTNWSVGDNNPGTRGYLENRIYGDYNTP